MPAKFIQLIESAQGLVALDEDGGVWRYYQARKFQDRNAEVLEGKVLKKHRTQYAKWIRLTSYRWDSRPTSTTLTQQE